ncbi:hypothetical protein NY10_16 [Carnobacterium antarcticum]|nr:hypothetical protein NY10_16 [Carnobacterium sp. CP1]
MSQLVCFIGIFFIVGFSDKTSRGFEPLLAEIKFSLSAIQLN